MNIYFLLEGKRTEKKVYPNWLSILAPSIKRIENPYLVSNNDYFIISGKGFPALLNNHLKNSIDEVNEIQKFDYLVIALDADEETVSFRKNEVLQFMKINNLELKNCKLKIIVQNRTIETWFLGNKRVFKSQPDNAELSEFIKFYNVSVDDPELMGVHKDFNNHAHFHHSYLTKMLRERNISYTKNHPRDVIEEHYINELKDRIKHNPYHLNSLKCFFDFCDEIMKQ